MTRSFLLRAPRSGLHPITGEVTRIVQESGVRGGLCNVFLRHTSASLLINENADPDVRGDLERHFNVMVPEHADYYEHTLEGPDDTTSHIKSVIIGPSLTIPISHGHLALGTWQGIYLCEHRNHAGGRKIVATLQGRW